MLQKISYLLTCAKKTITNNGFYCPSCNNFSSKVIARKYLITTLRRCSHCQLLFRTPTTSAAENTAFYQENYSQEYTTDCPSDEILQTYLTEGFSGMQKDYSSFIAVIRAAGGKEGGRLLDFGCSWGYGSWQFTQKGYDVESFEISKPRAKYAADKLSVNVHTSLSTIDGPFDIFFSSHVLEHVPSVEQSITFGMNLLKPGGLFIAFTPNGSQEYRDAQPTLWDKLWGMVHPNFLDEKFYSQFFSNKPILLSSNPYDTESIKQWANAPISTKLNIKGNELLVLVKK